MNLSYIRPHYLLKIDTAAISFGNSSFNESVPASVWRELEETNFVVVRRGLITENWVPIGIRGPQRFQRWAAWCSPVGIRQIITPADLLTQLVTTGDSQATPLRRALQSLMTGWQWFKCPWGPGGSLGFELASGKSTTTSGSDLDIIIYADEQFSRTVAQQLIAATNNLEVPVDIRIETPMCGFSLAEYAGSDAQKILLRTSAGPVLAHEPWDAKAVGYRPFGRDR
jgi:phosphoribosyl-dephospho-CoA transferase